jgi:hypothetical protein
VRMHGSPEELLDLFDGRGIHLQVNHFVTTYMFTTCTA